MKINVNNCAIAITVGNSRQFPRDARPQIALSGRSNVGKSSLINTLLGRKSLARVSSAPGKTITINYYDIDKKLYLVDLPGYGYAKRSQESKRSWSSLTEEYFTKNPSSVPSNSRRMMKIMKRISATEFRLWKLVRCLKKSVGVSSKSLKRLNNFSE